MAVVAFTVSPVTRSATLNLTTALPNTPAQVIATDQYTAPNDGKTLVRFKTSGTGSTMTVFFQGTNAPALDSVALGTDKGRTVVNGATADTLAGPFPVATYGDTLYLGFSSVATVTVGIIQPS